MKTINYILGGFFILFAFSACLDDLDQNPIAEDSFTQIDVFSNEEEAKKALAKLYASLALTGQAGPAGSPDISGIDEGTSQFSRMLFTLNELSTDHAVCAWGDVGLPDMHAMTWGPDNSFVQGIYYRLGQEISFCNSFISNAQPMAADENVSLYITEARFLRAYAYYNLLDLFGNVPLETEVRPVVPQQAKRKDIYTFVEAELLEIESLLAEAKGNEYARVDRAAAWALLSRLYLNAEVYTGQAQWDQCITYSNKVINSAYTLHDSYPELFMGDNDANGAQNEFIFTLVFDGLHSQSWGGATFLVNACIGGDMNPEDYGSGGGWAGNRTTKALVNKFEVSTYDANNYPNAWNDDRALFFTSGQNYEIHNISIFTEGYAFTKFKNTRTDGQAPRDPAKTQGDVDIPLIRLAEIYLNYAEASMRGASNGDATQALNLVNQLRTRANTSPLTSLDLQTILDERSRELYMEGLRRTDLIRYKQFTSATYLWPWKGGARNGTAVGVHRNLFPIPTNILFANPNMSQNTGY